MNTGVRRCGKCVGKAGQKSMGSKRTNRLGAHQDFWEGVCPVTSGVKPAFYPKNIIPTVKWWSCDGFWLLQMTWNHEFCSLPENPKENVWPYIRDFQLKCTWGMPSQRPDLNPTDLKQAVRARKPSSVAELKQNRK